MNQSGRRRRGQGEEARVAKKNKKYIWREETEEKQEKREGRRRAGMAANEEGAFRNGLGRVCGEPVARQWVCRSGSKRLFLSSEFPGSRLAAIPGTGVTFPPVPTEQGERGGGPWTCAHYCTCTQANHTCEHPRLRTLNVEACSHPHLLTLSFSFQTDAQMWCIHTHTQSHLRIHTCMATGVRKALRSKHNRLHECQLPSFVAHNHAWTRRHFDGSSVWDVLLQCVHVPAWDGERSSLKDEQECGVKDQMGWAGKGRTERGGRDRNGGMRGKGSDEEMNEEGWQMATFNNRVGEVAMSWIMRNQNKGCFQKDVLLEACALAGDTQADTCTDTQKHRHTHLCRRMFTDTYPE